MLLSGNPIFALMLNSFAEMYRQLGPIYYTLAQTRHNSRGFHDDLLAAARANAPDQVERVMQLTLNGNLRVWQQTMEMVP